MFLRVWTRLRAPTVLVLLAVICNLLLGTQQLAWATPSLKSRLTEYCNREVGKLGKDAAVGISVAELASGKELFDLSGEKLLVPASVLKIVTSVAALRYLGPDYRFITELFTDRTPQENAGAVGNLYVRGYGDPTLVNEELWNVVRSLKHRGVKEVSDIVIDDTLFVDPPAPSGSDPFQAALSATSVNFNSYAIDVAPGAVGSSALVSVAPSDQLEILGGVRTLKGDGEDLVLDQSPTSSGFRLAQSASGKGVAERATLALGPLRIKLTGSIGAERKLVTLYRSVPHPPSYFGWVLRSLLNQVGIRVQGKILIGETPEHAKELITVTSKELAVVLKDLNQFSNNFIAGQILYALGQEASTGRFKLSLALERLGSLLGQWGIEQGSYDIYDGSGLDRRNRISTQQLLKVMHEADRDLTIGPVLISSMSRFGHSGTLKKRILLAPGRAREDLALRHRAEGVWGKTGTLDGVSSLAGYALTPVGERIGFVVIINGPVAKDESVRFEDGLVREIIGAGV